MPALAAYLRPYRGQLGAQWLDIDRSRRTLLIRLSESGFSAMLIGRWLGESVRITRDPEGGRLLRGQLRGARHRAGARALVWFGIKQYRGEGKARVVVTAKDEFQVNLDSENSALGFLGLHYFAGLTPKLEAQLDDAPTEESLRAIGLRPAEPPWAVGFVARAEDGDVLGGFDPDPLIAARGTADGILSFAGLIPESPKTKYENAARELREAAKAVSSQNESVLQGLIERKPWILVHEADYLEANPRPSLRFAETLESGEEVQRRIVPDMLFKLPDSETLVIEIESATKRLLIKGEETSYQKPASPTTAAGFQIQNYKKLFDGFAGAQLRRALSLPDAWTFRYLLVVGSELQEDFNRRSWVNLRDTLGAGGVTVRNWDYYIDRLERLAQAADFAGGKPRSPNTAS